MIFEFQRSVEIFKTQCRGDPGDGKSSGAVRQPDGSRHELRHEGCSAAVVFRIETPGPEFETAHPQLRLFGRARVEGALRSLRIHFPVAQHFERRDLSQIEDVVHVGRSCSDLNPRVVADAEIAHRVRSEPGG